MHIFKLANAIRAEILREFESDSEIHPDTHEVKDVCVARDLIRNIFCCSVVVDGQQINAHVWPCELENKDTAFYVRYVQTIEYHGKPVGRETIL